MRLCPFSRSAYQWVFFLPGAVKVVLFDVGLGDGVLAQWLQLGSARVLFVPPDDVELGLDLDWKVMRVVLRRRLVGLKGKKKKKKKKVREVIRPICSRQAVSGRLADVMNYRQANGNFRRS